MVWQVLTDWICLKDLWKEPATSQHCCPETCLIRNGRPVILSAFVCQGYHSKGQLGGVNSRDGLSDCGQAVRLHRPEGWWQRVCSMPVASFLVFCWHSLVFLGLLEAPSWSLPSSSHGVLPVCLSVSKFPTLQGYQVLKPHPDNLILTWL